MKINKKQFGNEYSEEFGIQEELLVFQDNILTGKKTVA